jgi:hypothetical protein
MTEHHCTTNRHPEPCPSCWANCGCRCDDCTAQRARQVKRRRHLNATGHREQVPIEPIAQHVNNLRRTMSVTEIATAAGVWHDTVRRVANRTHPTINRRHARALLAVEAAPLDEQKRGRVDGTGTRRRLQALHALGFTSTALAHELGTDVRTAWRLLHADGVYATTRAAVVVLYERLRHRTPPVENRYHAQAIARARNDAQRNGWPPPDRWDDAKIDDPAATPRATAVRPKRDSAETAEEVELMIGTDNAENIARRLGYADYDSLASVLKRGGHGRIADRLRAQKVA